MHRTARPVRGIDLRPEVIPQVQKRRGDLGSFGSDSAAPHAAINPSRSVINCP